MSRVRKVVSTSIALIVALGFCAAIASAQVTGTVTGVVRDSSNGRIPGATVSLIRETKSTSVPDAVTSANGDYTFVTSTLQVSLPGRGPAGVIAVASTQTR